MSYRASFYLLRLSELGKVPTTEQFIDKVVKGFEKTMPPFTHFPYFYNEKYSKRFLVKILMKGESAASFKIQELDRILSRRFKSYSDFLDTDLNTLTQLSSKEKAVTKKYRRSQTFKELYRLYKAKRRVIRRATRTGEFGSFYDFRDIIEHLPTFESLTGIDYKWRAYTELYSKLIELGLDKDNKFSKFLFDTCVSEDTQGGDYSHQGKGVKLIDPRDGILSILDPLEVKEVLSGIEQIPPAVPNKLRNLDHELFEVFKFIGKTLTRAGGKQKELIIAVS